MKCPNPACDYTPEPSDWCCEACGTLLQGASTPAVAASASCACLVCDADGYCEACGKKKEVRPEPVMVEASSALACISDVGRKHHVNQDAALVAHLPNGDIFMAVADGVSTAQDSELASKIAVTTILNVLQGGVPDNPGDALVQAIRAADDAIRAMPYEQNPRLVEPQATIVAALVRGSNTWISWVGDSRAYQLGAQSQALTRDDSWYELALAQGVSKEVAQADRNAHSITQCLGMRDGLPEVHLEARTLEAGSSLLLCSDGLWNYFEEPAELLELFGAGAKTESAMNAITRMVDNANRAGGRDNISAALLKAA